MHGSILAFFCDCCLFLALSVLTPSFASFQPIHTLHLNPSMRSPARVALALGLVGPAGCQAFLGPPLRAAAPTSTTSAAHHQQPCLHYSAAASSHSGRFSPARGGGRAAEPLSRSSGGGALLLPLCMSSDGNDEEPEKKATKSPSELMDEAAEADFVARASTTPEAGPSMVGPAKQPEADKRKQREESFELSKPENNKWASGAFKRGVALQVHYSRQSRVCVCVRSLLWFGCCVMVIFPVRMYVYVCKPPMDELRHQQAMRPLRVYTHLIFH